MAHPRQLAQIYAALGNDATLKLTTEAPWAPGLYVNTAHGSRGLITAPLAGEMSGHIFFKERWYGFDDALYAGARLLEILARVKDIGRADLDDVALEEECRLVGDAGGLLHVMGHDHDGVMAFQLEDQVLDVRGRSGVERSVGQG